MKWLIPCNPNKYDIFRAYSTNETIDWRMKGYKYNVGDTVYIYVSRPHSKIMFKCEIIMINIPFSDSVDDAIYWNNKPDNLDTSKYARLKVKSKFDDDKVNLQSLMELDLKMAPVGPMTLKKYNMLLVFLEQNEHLLNQLNTRKYINYNWDEYAGGVWDILIDTAENGQTIFYSELTSKFGKHHRTAKYMLEPIQEYCIDNELPVLTAVVINKEGLKPGHGFIPSDFQREMIKVFDYDWKEVVNPFPSVLRKCKTDNADGTKTEKDVYKESLGKHRVGQGIFRDLLLQKYEEKCCLCNVSGKEFLIASHIKPWNECEPGEHLDPNNGLLLCPNHDKLFDKNLISFDYSGNIIISDSVTETNRIFLNININLSIKLDCNIEKYMLNHRKKIV